MNAFLAIFIGGGMGSLARFGVGKWMADVLPVTFPYGTLMANIMSSLILGLFLGITAGKPENENQFRFLIAVGFCGGFSTFSSFSAETFELFRNGMFLNGGINILANLISCILMIGIGAWLGRNF
jgi:fluoride exporter